MQDNDIDGSGGAASGGVTAPQTVADVLDAAADLLEKPEAWTQNEIARAADGSPISPMAERAQCFCAGGAIVRAAGGNSNAGPALRFFRVFVPGRDIADFNDAPGRVRSEVVAALRAAATSARQGETK